MPPVKSEGRVKIEENVRRLVNANRGRLLYEFWQNEYSDFWEEHAGGKCNGISILWLRHQHSELQSRAFEQLLKVRYREMEARAEEAWEKSAAYVAADALTRRTAFTAEEQQIFDAVVAFGRETRAAKDAVRQADRFAHVLHKRMHVDGQVNPWRTKVTEVQRVRALMKSYDMTFERTETFAGGWFHGHSDLGKFVAKAGTASMVHTSKHAMAACNTLGKPRFFDPNFGCFEFNGGSDLGSFLSAFFKIPRVNAVYGGHEDYQKLNVVADRYSYQVTRTFVIA